MLVRKVFSHCSSVISSMRFLVLLKSCVVHQNVEAGQILRRFVPRLRGRTQDLSHRPESAGSGGLQLPPLARLLRVSLFCRKEDHGNICAFTRIKHGDSAANSGIAAGDQRNFVQKLVCSAIQRGFVFWARLHVRFNPRVRLMLFGKRRLRLSSAGPCLFFQTPSACLWILVLCFFLLRSADAPMLLLLPESSKSDCT